MHHQFVSISWKAVFHFASARLFYYLYKVNALQILSLIMMIWQWNELKWNKRCTHTRLDFICSPFHEWVDKFHKMCNWRVSDFCEVNLFADCLSAHTPKRLVCIELIKTDSNVSVFRYILSHPARPLILAGWHQFLDRFEHLVSLIRINSINTHAPPHSHTRTHLFTYPLRCF